MIARVPQKNGWPWPKMLVPPPPSSVNILYWAVPSSIAPRSSTYDASFAGIAGLAELGDGLLAGGGVARLVVVVLDVDRRTAGGLDVLDGQIGAAGHRLAVERPAAGQGEDVAHLELHAGARCRGIDLEQLGERRTGTLGRASAPVVAAPPAPVVAAPPPPPVVAALLPLSSPHAARTAGLTAIAAPAMPIPLSILRRLMPSRLNRSCSRSLNFPPCAVNPQVRGPYVDGSLGACGQS